MSRISNKRETNGFDLIALMV